MRPPHPHFIFCVDRADVLPHMNKNRAPPKNADAMTLGEVLTPLEKGRRARLEVAKALNEFVIESPERPIR